jgi:TolA-binding protein
MLDIHRGLKDYGKAMATLQELQRTAVDGEEKYRLEYEIAAMYFDMADYAKAAAKFREILGAARATSDRLAIRDAYAKALFRGGDVAEAAAQFETLTREEPDPLRSYVDNLMAFYCRFAAGKAEEQQFPEDAALFIQTYEKLGEAERGRLTPSQFATATWIYYTQALIDLKKARVGAAMEKLNAITTSPDDFLAADAAYQLGMLHMERKDYEKAREMFEYLLFSTRSAESAVRATFALGRCFQALGMEDKARERFAQVVERYPLSPCAGMIRAGAATQAVDRAAQPQPGEGKP